MSDMSERHGKSKGSTPLKGKILKKKKIIPIKFLPIPP